jgi:hypothetical protein
MILKLLAPVAALAMASAASAVTVTEVSGNLDAFAFAVAGTNITIREVWGPTTDRVVRLEFDGLELGVDYTVTKIVTNNSGFSWVSFGHELLLIDGSASDDDDGLSFAQDSGIARTSTDFDTLFVDELGLRDFLNWYGGSVGGSGSVTTFSYGLRDGEGVQPFLLEQTANVPEPATWALMILGFGLIGFAARARKAPRATA